MQTEIGDGDAVSRTARRCGLLVALLMLMLPACDASPGLANVAHSSAAPAIASPAQATWIANAPPRDDAVFKTRRDDCDHFRGEEADDEARATELNRKLEGSCPGSDAALKALRRKYAGNATVLSALADYEELIE